MQIIYTANEEVARGLYNPAYKLLQMLPGRQTKGQLCIQKFHSVMQDLMQEVTCLQNSHVTLVQTAQNATFGGTIRSCASLHQPWKRSGQSACNKHVQHADQLLSFLQHC